MMSKQQHHHRRDTSRFSAALCSSAEETAGQTQEVLRCVVRSRRVSGPKAILKATEKPHGQAERARRLKAAAERMMGINMFVKMFPWLLATAAGVNGAKVSQWPSKACRRVGESVLLSCEVQLDPPGGRHCTPHWSVKGGEFEVQFDGRYCEEDLGFFSYVRISGLQASDSGTVVWCSMDCMVDRFRRFNGKGSVIEVKAGEELCSSAEEVAQWSSGTQQYTGGFAVFSCAMDIRKELNYTCEFSWYVRDLPSFQMVLVTGQNPHSHRLLVETTEKDSLLILSDLQLSDSSVYYCQAKCSVGCVSWVASGNGSALVVTEALGSEDEASGEGSCRDVSCSLSTRLAGNQNQSFSSLPAEPNAVDVLLERFLWTADFFVLFVFLASLIRLSLKRVRRTTGSISR
ncbi:uncharacterized protein LOC108930299 [Arapaima gigas]